MNNFYNYSLSNFKSFKFSFLSIPIKKLRSCNEITDSGVPYGEMILEAAGDFSTSSWGAEICSIDVVETGRGTSCFQRMTNKDTMKSNTVYSKT